jgi:hypothetical protein
MHAVKTDGHKTNCRFSQLCENFENVWGGWIWGALKLLTGLGNEADQIQDPGSFTPETNSSRGEYNQGTSSGSGFLYPWNKFLTRWIKYGSASGSAFLYPWNKFLSGWI